MSGDESMFWEDDDARGWRERALAAEARAERLAGALWLGMQHATGELTAITMAQWALFAKAAFEDDPPTLREDIRIDILAKSASKPGLEDALRQGDAVWEQVRADRSHAAGEA